jgi:serine/threonine-protein kinase
MLESVCLDLQERPVFIDRFSHAVLRVEHNGRLTLVAGNFHAGYGGDGIAAIEAALNEPYDVHYDVDGNLYISDFSNNRIRRVDRNGIIWTAVGNGRSGYSGDGGLATNASIGGAWNMLPGRDGELFIADSRNNVIRHVDRKGTIRAVAGTGKPGLSGDGGPALAARFDAPQGLALSNAGLIISDEHNNVLRLLTSDGTVRRLAGSGRKGSGGDGGPAAEAEFNDPENVLVRHDGTMLVTDGANGCIRQIDAQGRITRWAGRR